MLRPRFQLVAVGILAFWLVMMAMLVRREVLIPRFAGQSFQASAVPDVPKDTWMGVYLQDGQQIGYVHTKSIPELRDGEEGARLELTVSMRTRILGKVTPVRVAGDAWASATNGLREFEFSIRSGDHEAAVRAAIADGVLDATFELDGDEFPIEWPVEDDLFLWSGMGASNVYFPAMEVGDEFFIDAFDPVTLSKSPVLIRCVGMEDLTIGDTVYPTKVIEMEYDTMTARAHIDPRSGDVLRAETPLGITLQRVDPADMQQAMSDEEVLDLLDFASVAPSGIRPHNGATRMVFRVASSDAWTAIPKGHSQRTVERAEDTYEVVVPSVTGHSLAPYPLPDQGVPTVLAESLRASNSAWEQIESISALAASGIGSNSISDAAALTPLGAGGAAGRFAELASAAGFEVRLIAGVAWSNADRVFAYHVWPEVKLDRWYWVDPTVGQVPADAARIQLSDSPDDWPRLMGLLQSLEIEVLEIE